MLSLKTIATVKSTAPILEEHGEVLTRHFYQRMFKQNPEVIPFFNPAHQKEGKQQKALAAAICAYAANIDQLEVLGSAVELIAQKHASLLVKPEHYPIVGDNLLASIKEVLGAGATDEIIEAWAEAYGFLADILIGREKQIYHDQVEMPGGWEGFKPFKVMRKVQESEVITSFYLVPADGTELPRFKPGQYITVRLPTQDGSTTMRNYSLSNKVGENWFRISVKIEGGHDEGKQEGYVSTSLHRQIQEGDSLDLAPPCGEFFLDLNDKHDRPLVLLAAGVGITPIYSILASALEAMPNREIILIHGSLNEKVQAFKDDLAILAKKHSNLKIHFRYSEQDQAKSSNDQQVSFGLIDAELVESMVPNREGDYYFCGPKPFMLGIYHELLRWGIPSAQVHFEFFGPKQGLEK